MASNTPSQIRAVDPFSSYNSDTVNKLTRMKTFGQDVLATANGCNIIIDSTSDTQVILLPGAAYKDNVLIEVLSQHIVDFTDPDHYYSFGTGFDEAGYYYIVLSYTYQRQRPAPEAEILIVKPSQRNLYVYGGTWLFLKAVHVSDIDPGPGVDLRIDEVVSYDPDNVSNERMIARGYAGTEVSLPTFSSLRDTSRVVYSEEDNDFFFGLSDRWSFPLSGSGGSVFPISTIGFTQGDLVYVSSTGNLALASANIKNSTADGAVLTIGSSGLVQTTGRVENVNIEPGSNVEVNDLLYLSTTIPGTVTNVQSSPFHQFVGRCIENVDSTTVTILFVRGEPTGSGATEFATYVSDTLAPPNWILSGSLYYQDVDISSITGVSAGVTVWDTTSELKITPAEIEFVDASTLRIWMSVNNLTLGVLAIGPSAAIVSSSDITELYETLPSGGSWISGTYGYYQDIDVSSIITQDSIVLARDTATNMKVIPSEIQFDSTNNLKIWMPVNTKTLEVSVIGPGLTSTSTIALTSILASGSSWVYNGGLYYQDISVAAFGDNQVIVQFMDTTNDTFIEPTDVEFISSSVIRVWMSTNTKQLNVTIIG